MVVRGIGQPMSRAPSGFFLATGIAVAGLFALAIEDEADAQGDGPRAYQLVPDGTQSYSEFLFWMSGNNAPSQGTIIEGADLNIMLGVSQYSTTVDIAGHQAGLLAVVPYGDVSGSLSTLHGRTPTGGDSGFGDTMFGVAFGMIGAPALTPEQYMAYDPGFSMAALALVTAPTGSYSSNRVLNMGGNRWVFDLGLPMMYYAGKSFRDPHLTSFELMPKVSFFTDNTDAPGFTDVLEQAPIYSLEGHVTRNFGTGFWASLDALYEYGGETKSDGISDNNLQQSLMLGASASFGLTPAATLKFTYGRVIWDNATGSDETMVRAQFTALF
ncbi:MAG: transporter [Bauldia sp.]|nr:transporter [Bauldia sp.]